MKALRDTVIRLTAENQEYIIKSQNKFFGAE